MKTMNVLRFNNNLNAPALIAGIAPVPEPKAEEILIRVYAAGVTPTELLWYPTTHGRAGEARSGAVPGHEFSGVVERVGAAIDPSWMGREVYGMNDWFADGASAEYCLSTPNSVATKPARLSHAEAASVPIGALTAWQGLFDRAKLRSGERVLIHGGAGAVGVFAIQLARRAGAHVITTCSPRNFDFLSGLGAHELFDYHAQRFEDNSGQVDVVFDVVGGETLKRSWNLLKPNGRLVTIAAKSEGTKDERIEKAFFIVEPNQQQLTDVARLLDTGELQCFIDAKVPMAKASDAYGGKLTQRMGRGKVVLSIAS
jgi:NADPH:quinone reductase-like Zn-dependent oxidoreductase